MKFAASCFYFLIKFDAFATLQRDKNRYHLDSLEAFFSGAALGKCRAGRIHPFFKSNARRFV